MSDDELWDRLQFSGGREKYRILYQLAHNKLHEKEHLQALAFIQQAGDYAKSQDFLREHAHALHMAGYLHYLLDNYDEAVITYSQASKIMHSIGIDSDTANIEGSIGEAYWQTRDYENASKHYEVAFNLYDSIDDYGNASVASSDFADSMLRLGRLQEVGPWFGISAEYAKKARDPHRLFHAFRGFARLGLLMGDSNLAIEFATKARAIASTCSCKYCMPDSDLLLGQAYIFDGQANKGVAYIDLAHKKYHEHNAMQKQAFCELEYGHAALLMGDYRKAQKHLEQASLFTEMFDEPLYEFKVLVAQGTLQKIFGNHVEANELFANAYGLSKDNSYLRSVKHRMLSGYLETLELANQGQIMLDILHDIQEEKDSWLLSTYHRMAFSARAHLLTGNKTEALRDADGGLVLNCDDIPAECTASLHLTRAEAFRESNPRLALDEAHKAISYFIHSGDFERAEFLARIWVVEPDQRLREQQIAEENRNKYEEIFTEHDPITKQVQDEFKQLEGSSETNPEEGIA